MKSSLYLRLHKQNKKKIKINSQLGTGTGVGSPKSLIKSKYSEVENVLKECFLIITSTRSTTTTHPNPILKNFNSTFIKHQTIFPYENIFQKPAKILLGTFMQIFHSNNPKGLFLKILKFNLNLISNTRGHISS